VREAQRLLAVPEMEALWRERAAPGLVVEPRQVPFAPLGAPDFVAATLSAEPRPVPPVPPAPLGPAGRRPSAAR
jgi:hypothetical protein